LGRELLTVLWKTVEREVVSAATWDHLKAGRLELEKETAEPGLETTTKVVLKEVKIAESETKSEPTLADATLNWRERMKVFPREQKKVFLMIRLTAVMREMECFYYFSELRPALAEPRCSRSTTTCHTWCSLLYSLLFFLLV
jgi:hypothetical protein